MFFSWKLHLSLSGHALCTNEAQRWVVKVIPTFACKHYKPITLSGVLHISHIFSGVENKIPQTSFFLISHGHWKSYKLLKILKITFIPAGDVFRFVFQCIAGLLSVGVWFVRIKPLQIADCQIKFSKCWQLKCCHMLMLLHHWKPELPVPRKHIRLLFVLCYPSGE